VALLFVLSGTLLGLSRPAHAESFDTCQGYIETVPTVITTQGIWCLRGDVSTAITSGAAITVASNNVTINCNDYKLGGLAGGSVTAATGIATNGRMNTRVRNCNIRGFRRGVDLVGDGHSVVDSRFDHNTSAAIRVVGNGNEVLRNSVRDTGGAPGIVAGIIADGVGVVEGNRIFVVASSGTHEAYGIQTSLSTGSVSGNVVASVVGGPDGSFGIASVLSPNRVAFRGNDITFDHGPVAGAALKCRGGVAKDNILFGHANSMSACVDGRGNVFEP
jgi:hypothetical protein